MMRLLLILIVALGSSASLASTPTTELSHFIRYIEDPDGAARLETAEVAYKNDADVDVHLIGAIHIADADYYSGLNESFEHYDALLYELVSSREGEDVPTSQPAGDRPLGWVGNLQRFMRDRLDLVFQLDAIDYKRPNFVHADLNVEQFLQMQSQRGESMFTLMFRSAMQNMAKGMKKGPDVSGFALLGALMSPNQSRELKRVLAEQFADAEDALDAMEGPNGSVIIGERNKAALRVMNEQIKGGKKYIGIFYGAGHLRLMEKSLREMGFHKVGETWRTAWDIPAPDAPTTRPVSNPKSHEDTKERSEHEEMHK
jgi:hypothetical protein